MAMVSHDPELASDAVTAHEFRVLMLNGKVMSMTVHFWLASLAIAGVFAADRFLATRSAHASDRRSDDDRFPRRAIIDLAGHHRTADPGRHLGAGSSRTGAAASRLLGGDAIRLFWFALGILSVFVVLHRLMRSVQRRMRSPADTPRAAVDGVGRGLDDRGNSACSTYGPLPRAQLAAAASLQPGRIC